MNNMLTLEEVRSFLEIEEAQLEKYLKQGKLHAYKIGGTYIRFRKEEVLNLRFESLPQKGKSSDALSTGSRLGDFWRFNNFYIISLLVVVALAYIVIRF